MTIMSSPSEVITKINENDIICGRKGVALKHPGNMAYRKIVGLNKELYATCMKNEKLRISKSIVAAMREVGGRFVERVDGRSSNSLDEKDENGNPVAYRDIGDKRAIEKTSQALREGQPKLLKKLAEEQVRRAPAVPPPPPQHQAHPYDHQAHPAYSTSSLAAAAVASRGYQHYDPYALHGPAPQASGPKPQAVTPPPSGLLPHLLSQFESDLLFLALLRRARERR